MPPVPVITAQECPLARAAQVISSFELLPAVLEPAASSQVPKRGGATPSVEVVSPAPGPLQAHRFCTSNSPFSSPAMGVTIAPQKYLSQLPQCSLLAHIQYYLTDFLD